ncbi:MAG: Nramp family divalent metal transporter [Bacteroidota bacterium]
MNSVLKALGPGILFASTCIGVSHLVQSTRAGADYGFGLIWAIIIANIFKYPFFEFASRYTSATGKSIIEGYQKEGKWVLWAYFIISIPSMFIVTAAVTFVASGLLSNIFDVGYSISSWSAILIAICAAILLAGNYNWLDGILKFMGIILVLSTVITFIGAAAEFDLANYQRIVTPSIWTSAGIPFLIALMGWMPTAVDISTWTSLWAEAKIESSGHRPGHKETLFDFNLGYWTSAVMALLFLGLGAFVLYGSGEQLSGSSAVFAGQLISVYTSVIGDWSFLIIAIAAFSTMFSTTITVIDGYGRALSKTLWSIGFGRLGNYKLFVVISGVGGYLIITAFTNNLKLMVDFATILSFIVAPLAAFLNYHIVFSGNFPDEFKPGKKMKILAIVGMVFLSVFTMVYFYTIVSL